MKQSVVAAGLALALSPFAFVVLCSAIADSDLARMPALVIATEHRSAAAAAQPAGVDTRFASGYCYRQYKGHDILDCLGRNMQPTQQQAAR